MGSMRIIAEIGNSSIAHLSSVFDLLTKVVERVATSDAESLWVMALELFAKDKRYFDELVNLSLVSLARDGGTDDGFPVTLVWQKDGIQQARDLYRRCVARYLLLNDPLGERESTLFIGRNFTIYSTILSYSDAGIRVPVRHGYGYLTRQMKKLKIRRLGSTDTVTRSNDSLKNKRN